MYIPYLDPSEIAVHIPPVAADPTTHPIPNVVAQNAKDTAAPATAHPVPIATEVPTLQASGSQALAEYVKKQMRYRYKVKRNVFFMIGSNQKFRWGFQSFLFSCELLLLVQRRNIK